MKPKISVIVPVYNVETYLRDCLDSILCQTFSEFEIICIDDGSTDGSAQILMEYKEKDSRIKVLCQENQGQSVARNHGIESAKGDYICFVDSDDMLVDYALMKLWRAVESDRVDVVIYETSMLLYQDETLRGNGDKDRYYSVSKEYTGIRTGRDFFVELVENNDFVDSVWLMFIRRKWLESKKIVFSPGVIYEDSIFAVECYFKCQRMKYLSLQLYIYRVRGNSTMTENYTFKHLYCRIWQFSELLKVTYQYAKDEREVSALAKYAEQSLLSASYTNCYLDDMEKKKIYNLKSLYELIAMSKGIMNIGEMCNRELALEGLLRVVEKSSNVVLYGAGIIGNKVRLLLKSNNLEHKIIGFAVTKESEITCLEGLPVRNIKDYNMSEDVLVIVSAKEQHHAQMVELLEQLDCKKMLTINYDIECIIDEKLSN